MDEGRFNRLSARQHDCLRLLVEHRQSKEIARELGLSLNTVNSYLSGSYEVLQVANRGEAARVYGEFLRRAAPPEPVYESSRVEPEPPTIAYPEPEGATSEPIARGSLVVAGRRLPFRARGGTRNDLTSPERLAWIAGLAVAMALLLVTTINILDALVRLIKTTTG